MRDLFSDSEMFVIGTSAGGVDALQAVLPAFTKTSRFRVAVVIHLPPDGPNLIPSLLASSCSLKISEAIPGEVMEADHIYIAPSDYHLCIEPNHSLSLSSEEPLNFSRPSIDILFESAAYAFGKKAVGILLTGANNDGAQGIKKIKEMGGIAIIQNPEEAEYNSMPSSALKVMTPQLILTVKEITSLISSLCVKGKDDG